MTLDNETVLESRFTAVSPLLSAQAVAAILDISVKTVHKLVREGKLPCVQVTAREGRLTRDQAQGLHTKERALDC